MQCKHSESHQNLDNILRDRRLHNNSMDSQDNINFHIECMNLRQCRKFGKMGHLKHHKCLVPQKHMESCILCRHWQFHQIGDNNYLDQLLECMLLGFEDKISCHNIHIHRLEYKYGNLELMRSNSRSL